MLLTCVLCKLRHIDELHHDANQHCNDDGVDVGGSGSHQRFATVDTGARSPHEPLHVCRLDYQGNQQPTPTNNQQPTTNNQQPLFICLRFVVEAANIRQHRFSHTSNVNNQHPNNPTEHALDNHRAPTSNNH